jgi:hypothetical protein
MARAARSLKTRKLYRVFVQRAAWEETSSPAQMPPATQPLPPVATPILGSLAVTTTDIESDTSESLVDAETSGLHDRPGAAGYKSHNVLPKLAFRVWDVSN